MNDKPKDDSLHLFKKRSVFDAQDGDRPIVLKNKNCIYCGIFLGKKTTREHVIGRKFVPEKKWDTDWNLIAKACEDCNNHKSKLENDISAITMQIHAADPTLMELVKKKSLGSKSAKTGRTVHLSEERATIELPFAPGIQIKFKLQAPPQIEDKRAFELARLQITAFFYLVTYNEELRQGKFFQGKFSPIACNIKSNWGNVTKKAFMVHVANWETRVIGITADCFFKVMLKKHPMENCFAWAIEWNQSHRVYGFFGDRALAESIYSSFPKIFKEKIPLKGDDFFAVSQDVPLEEDEDTMFKAGS